jgi:hypothetical protein
VRFPVASPLGFLTASRLHFRVTRGQNEFYQEIRFASIVNMRGFLSFLTDPATDTWDDEIYNTLRVQVSISNFPNSSRMDYRLTIVPGGTDIESISFIPDEATHLANLLLVAGGSVTTGKTATTMTVSEPGGAFVQQWDLSNLQVDPDGGGKSIRAWQHLMVDHLALLRPAVEAQQTTDIGNGLYTLEDTWDFFWRIVEDGGHFSPGPSAHVRDFSGGLISDNPPTGNLPPIGGNILQIQKSTNALAQPIFYDLLGVEGGHYYPGANVRNRSSVFANSSAIDPLRPSTTLPSYHAPDLVYSTGEILSCSETRHRIHSPVYLQVDHKATLLAGGLGPDTYDAGGPVLITGAVDDSGRVEFDAGCPANSIPNFWTDAEPDDFYVQQIYELDPATNVAPFVIPP